MNYHLIYERFISSRLGREPGGRVERHHITPRSIGGSDLSENIISLTPREHFFAHELLAKMYGGKMWAALACMSRGGTKSANGYRCTSRQYDFISRMDAEWRSVFYVGDGNPFYGKTHTDAALNKMRKPRVNQAGMYGVRRPGVGDVISFVLTYKPRDVDVNLSLMNRIDAMFEASAELKRLCSQYRRSESRSAAASKIDMTGSNNPNYGNGQAIAGEKNPMWGKQHLKSTRDKIGEKARRTLKCPHCDKVSNIANAHRWHFENCKHKQ